MADMETGLRFTDAGPVAPEPVDILARVEARWNAIFGNRLNLDPSTPQGQLIAALAALIAEKNAELLFLAQQLDPDAASGPWQDALGRIYFLERKPALAAEVRCLCRGLPGTRLPGRNEPEPALAADENGVVFVCRDGGVIPESGELALTFTARETGPLSPAAGTVTRILRVIPGWDDVVNPEPGIPGRDAETRAAFEARRRASVAANSHGSAAAIYASVFQVENVRDVAVRENPTSATVQLNGVTLVPHSVYVAVDGGADADVAQAIASRKSAGCAMNGNTVHVLADPTTGAVQSVRWERPAPLPLYLDVALRVNENTPSDIKERITAAALADATRTPPRLGETLYASRFYAPVLQTGALELLGVKLALQADGPWLDAVEMALNRVPAFAAERIQVRIEEDA